MPKIIVEIEWDTPDDPHWLNIFSIQMTLANACKNTCFAVAELPRGTSSEMWDAFSRRYGEIGENYDENAWMERYGVWVSAWTDAVKPIKTTVETDAQ